MFKIKIILAGPSYSGLEALDKCRQLGLPDRSHLDVAYPAIRGHHDPSCDVSEAFARAWFGRKQTQAAVNVHLDLVNQSDIRLLSNDYSITFADLTPERIQELFVVAKIKELRERIAYLETQLSPQETEEE